MQLNHSGAKDHIRKRNLTIIILVAIFCLSVILRLAAWQQVTAEPIMQPEALIVNDHYRAALQFANGDYLLALGSCRQGVVYPMLVGALLSVVGISPAALIITQILLAGLTAVLIFLLTKLLFGNLSALLAGLAAASQGTALFFSLQVQPVTMTLLLEALGLYWFMRGLTAEKRRWLLMAGMPFGLSLVTHFTLALPLLLMIGAASYHYRRKSAKLLSLALTLAVLALFPTFLMVGNRIITGRWQATPGDLWSTYALHSTPELWNQEPQDRYYQLRSLIHQPLQSPGLSQQEHERHIRDYLLATFRDAPLESGFACVQRGLWLVANDALSLIAPAQDFRSKSSILWFGSVASGVAILLPFSLLGWFVPRPAASSDLPVRVRALKFFALGYLLTNIFGVTGAAMRLPLVFAVLPLAGWGAVTAYRVVRFGSSLSRFLVIALLLGTPATSFLIKPPQMFPTDYYEALILKHQGLTEPAIEKLYDALRRQPKSAVVWKELSALLSQQNNYERAAKALIKTLELLPEDMELYNHLGLALRRTGDLQAAENAFQKALMIAPNHLPALVNLANLYRIKKQPEQAIAIFTQVLKLAPRHIHARTDLAMCYLERNESAKARQLLEEVLADSPEDPLVLYNYGLLLLSAKQWREAIEPITKALKAEPAMTMAWYNLGAAKFQSGDPEGATVAWETCLEQDPDFAPALSALVQAYSVLGKTEAADKMDERLEQLRKTYRPPQSSTQQDALRQ